MFPPAVAENICNWRRHHNELASAEQDFYTTGMNSRRFWKIVVCAAALGTLSPSVLADDTTVQQLAIIDEKLDKLRADVEALQFNQQKMQQQVDALKDQLHELRVNGAGVTPGDLQTLEARIKAIDNARENDKKVILDTLAKELEAISRGKPVTRGGSGSTSTNTTTSDGTEHIVQKGETLTVIAKAAGVSVEALKKANNIVNPDELKVGQRLTIPR